MTDKRLIQISHDLRAEAQNEHMVDQHFTALGKFLNEAANRILEVLGTGLNGRTIYDARIAVEAPSPREEHGWVIEGAWSDPASPEYWAGSSLWMADHMCAIRFAREHDAKQAASAMLDGMNIRICEHVWTGDIRESVSSENIRQSVSVSPREVALEKALRDIDRLATHHRRGFAKEAQQLARAALSRRAQPNPREVALTTFAREALQCALEGHDYNGGVAQDRATELGLLTRTTYDPEKHGEHDCCEPGDEYYVFSDWLSPAQKGERK